MTGIALDQKQISCPRTNHSLHLLDTTSAQSTSCQTTVSKSTSPRWAIGIVSFTASIGTSLYPCRQRSFVSSIHTSYSTLSSTMASATSSSGASPEQSATISDHLVQKAFSCVLCAQRKVKCDKRPGGCNSCTKARVPCIYKAPPPPRRRRKGVRDVDTATKLRIYEDALRQAGIDPESLVRQASPYDPHARSNRGADRAALSEPRADLTEQKLATEIGVLITDQGKSRYLENGIWTSLRSEFRDIKEILDETSDEDSFDDVVGIAPEGFSPDGSKLIFGSPAPSIGLRPLHPQPVESFKLWQAYLDNINPLVKLFHAPSVQQIISEANGNLDEVPRNVEALLFAIYCIVVESLSDGECIIITGQPKIAARQRFRAGAQHALINASFLKTSDLMVLQALTLFIVSSRMAINPFLGDNLTRSDLSPGCRRSHYLDAVWNVSADRSTHRPAPRWRQAQSPTF